MAPSLDQWTSESVTEGVHYIAQELVEGGHTLAHMLAELRKEKDLPPPSRISSAEEKRGLIYGEIILNVKGAKERFQKVIRTELPKAINLIRDKIVAP